MKSLLLFPILALAAFADEKPPAGLEAADGPKAGFGSLCQNDVRTFPELPGADAKKFGALAKTSRLAKGDYVVDSVKGSVDLETGTFCVKGDVDGQIHARRRGAVILIQGNFKGTIEAMCPFTIVIGGSSDGEITANHDPSDRVHEGCHVIVGWFPGDEPGGVAMPGGGVMKKDPPEPPKDPSLEAVPRRGNITARGTIRASSVVVLGRLEGTVDSRNGGLSVHVDEVDLGRAKILGGSQHVCFARFLWEDYPALIQNVLASKANANRMTQLTFNHSDLPKGFYRATDKRLLPQQVGEVEIRVLESGARRTPDDGKDDTRRR